MGYGGNPPRRLDTYSLPFLSPSPLCQGILEQREKVTIWTGTWNLRSNEPFAGMEKVRAHRLLQPLVPAGYDVYVLGVQDCVSESIFECLESLLHAEGCRRLKLDLDPFITTEGRVNSAAPSDVSSDASKLYGRGEGSLLSSKFTGIAVFVRSCLLGDVKVLASTSIAFSSLQSKGAVAVALSVLGRSIVFVNCHWDAKHVEKRRDNFQELVVALGSQLAEEGFIVNVQFHHMVWMGDFNYRLVDTSGNPMPVDSAVKMLEDKRLCRTLFESHDQLLQERRSHFVFFGFREPVPFPNFFPTFKKIEGRHPVDYSDSSWVKSTYRIQHKQPFYKGGSVKETTPGFCDRILYYSVADLAEDLLPECVPTEMLILPVPASDGGAPSNANANANGSSGLSTMRFTVDNYRSVNDGESMTISSHSPVFATFVLRIRHDYEKLLKESNDKQSSAAGIHTVFSALGFGSDRSVSALESDSTRSRPNGPFSKADDAVKVEGDGEGVGGDGIEERNGAALANVKPLKYSLLAGGTWHRIRLSSIKLLWGTNDEVPRYVSVMFPAPYEVMDTQCELMASSLFPLLLLIK